MKPFFHDGSNWSRIVISVCLLVLLSGCSWFKKEDTTAGTETMPALEVPPDLTKPETTSKYQPQEQAAGVVQETKPGYQPQEQMAGAVQETITQAQLQEELSGRVAPRWQGVQRMRDGQQYWLLVSATPEQTWPLISDFLKLRGYSIAQSEAAIGIMETDWKTLADTENDGVTSLRERVRVRVEAGPTSGRTEVFLSVKNSERLTAEGAQWQRSIADDERAIELLNRLAQYLGASKIDNSLPAARTNSAPDTAAPDMVVPDKAAPAAVVTEEFLELTPTEAEKQILNDRQDKIEKDCALCPPR